MGKFIRTTIVLLICGLIVYYRKPVATFLYKTFIFKKEVVIPSETLYKKDTKFMFIEDTDNFYPKNKQDIMNIIYTVLNSSWTNFSFYCDDSYKECFDDVNEIAYDQTLLGHINNYVHPYNTYEEFALTINTFNKVTIKIKKQYSDTDILEIDKKVDEIYNSQIKDNMSDYDKIKKIHDYIINTTVYDEEKVKNPLDPEQYRYKTNMAYGPLINGIALCGGYTDAMALFLEKMNIPNYRISSNNHIWNLVYINNEWKHLDLTWDDPVDVSGGAKKKNILTHKFFLISTNTLKNLDKDEHNFDSNIYLEAK